MVSRSATRSSSAENRCSSLVSTVMIGIARIDQQAELIAFGILVRALREEFPRTACTGELAAQRHAWDWFYVV